MPRPRRPAPRSRRWTAASATESSASGARPRPTRWRGRRAPSPRHWWRRSRGARRPPSRRLPRASRPPSCRRCRNRAHPVRPANALRPPRPEWPSPWWPTRWAPTGSLRTAAPGTCPRCAGPASRCRARRVSRWPAPRRCSRRAGSRCPRRPPAPHPRVPRGRRPRRRRPCVPRRTPPDRGPVCRAAAGHGVRGRRWRPVAQWRHARPRYRRRRPECLRRSAHAQGDGPKGDSRPNLPGLRMPLGSNVALRPRRTSKPEPSARGRKRERLSPMPW